MWLYKLKLLYNLPHVFPSYAQTSHFVPIGQLFILYTVLHDIHLFKLLMPQSHWAPGTPRFTPVHGPGWTGEYRGLNRSPPWWTGMMHDGPGWTGGLSGGFWHVKNNRGEPWRTGKGSPTWVNRVEPCWHRRSTGKDREGSWRCRRWPGSTGMEKNELSTPGGQRFTAVLPVPHG